MWVITGRDGHTLWVKNTITNEERSKPSLKKRDVRGSVRHNTGCST
jgi:hypothetical protein